METKNLEEGRVSIQNLLKQMNDVLIGQSEALKLALGAFLSGGHVLIEDIPGVGKTTLVKTLAAHVEVDFQRVQFTPDLLPSDVIGVSIYEGKSQQFVFKKGPVFTQLFMADEINRASPKTQSSLLEAMEEKQVTIDGTTYPLKEPFMVIATQNPVEFEGTFPLPEAQLDRFMIQLKLGYPSKEDEMTIYKKDTKKSLVDPKMRLSIEALKRLSEEISAVQVSDLIYGYVQELVALSRRHENLYYGLSPRAGIALVKMAKYYAYLAGRGFVIPEDVKSVGPCVMRHRLFMKPEALYKEQTIDQTIEEIFSLVNVPKGSFDHEL